MNRYLALPLVMLLAACGSGGVNPIVKDAFTELNPFGGEEDEAKPRRTATSRASIEQANVAAIRARILDENARSTLLAMSQNGGYVTYASRIGQSVTAAGARVTATRGLGYDLLSVKVLGSDPVVRATPPSAWPATMQRVYTFPGEGPGGTKLRVTCAIERGEITTTDILGKTIQGVQFSETCQGDGQTFENLYLADVRTGFVWRSLQWIGPDLGNLDVEVIEPFGD